MNKLLVRILFKQANTGLVQYVQIKMKAPWAPDYVPSRAKEIAAQIEGILNKIEREATENGIVAPAVAAKVAEYRAAVRGV